MTPPRFCFTAAFIAGLLVQSLFWMGVLLGVAWVTCAWFWPFAPCWSCQGRKTNRGSTKRRFGKCRRCDGSGSRQVIGSRSLHKAVRAAVKFRDERGK